MVTEKLQSLFHFTDVSVMHTNEAFGFHIKAGKSKVNDCLLLYTEGLSQKMQPVDAKNQKYERIELYFMLPEFWDLSAKKWPIEWLNRIAQVPQKNKTWFGIGDTLPAGMNPEPIDPQLNCNYFILSESLLPASKLTGENWQDCPFQMMAVIPIFAKEFDFKKQYSSQALLQIFRDKQISEMIDLFRQPVARKKFMGIF